MQHGVLRLRLGLPVLPQGLLCEGYSCRQNLDTKGYHRLTCMRTGRTHWRHAHALSGWHRVFEEAGYSVRVEHSMRHECLTDSNLRMDLVALPRIRGLGARRGCTLFCDLILASPLTGDGGPRPGCAGRPVPLFERHFAGNAIYTRTRLQSLVANSWYLAAKRSGADLPMLPCLSTSLLGLKHGGRPSPSKECTAGLCQSLVGPRRYQYPACRRGFTLLP